MSLAVRRATPDDASAIAGLINRAFAVEAFFVEGERTSPDDVKQMLERGVFLLAEEAGRLAGCVFVSLSGERGYFGLLSVDPELQGRGLGRRLVAAAEEHCRRGGCRVVDIRVVNLRTELPPFYAALGYHEVGSAPFPPESATKLPCHFLLMSKPLAEWAL